MLTSEQLARLARLRVLIDKLAQDDVDDANEILTELAIGSEDFREALDAAIEEVQH